jgi:hypothetical protein
MGSGRSGVRFKGNWGKKKKEITALGKLPGNLDKNSSY